jgi:hypothetical protein
VRTDTARTPPIVHALVVLSYDELMAQTRSLEAEHRTESDRADGERDKRVRLEEEKALALRQLEELRKSYAILQQEFELQRRRIFAAKAERIETAQLELDFEKTRAALDEMQKALAAAAVAAGLEVPPPVPPPSRSASRPDAASSMSPSSPSRRSCSPTPRWRRS